MIFAFLYWSIPYIYILWYDTRDNLHDYNKWLAMSNKAARALLLNPFDEAAKTLGTSTINLAPILLILVMGMYIAGFLLKRTYEAKRASADEEIYREYDGEYVIDDEDDVSIVSTSNELDGNPGTGVTLALGALAASAAAVVITAKKRK